MPNIKIIDPFTNVTLAEIPSKTDQGGSVFLSDLRELNIGMGGNNVFRADSQGIWLGGATFAAAPFGVSMAGAITASSITVTGGTFKYGKTSFSDSVHAGYYFGNEGWYVGSAADATKLKYTLADGTYDFVGTHSGGSVSGVPVAQVGYVATSTADAVPAGLTYSTGGISTGSDGSHSAYVVLTWTAISTNTFSEYLIRYKKASLTYYTYIPAKTNTITIEGLTPNISYNFGVASVNKYGAQSAFSSDITQTTVSDTVAPATVTAGSATGGIQYNIIEWTHNSDSDLASYNIYRNTTNSSATAVLVGNCRTNYFVDGGKTGGQIYYYWIKAVDTSGNESTAFSTAVSATPRNVTSDDVVTLAGSKVLIDGTVYLSNWRHTSDLTKIDGGSIYANSITTSQLNFTPVQTGNVIASINASAEGITIDADNITISGSTTFATGYNPSLKITTFLQDGIPTSISVGDIWIDTNDGNKQYRAGMIGADEIKAGEWELVSTQGGTIFAQSSIPTSLAIGDLWYDTDDGNKQYRAASVGADEIKAGEWEQVSDANKLNATGGAYASAASGARVLIFPDANTGIQVVDDSVVPADVFKVMVGGTDVGDVILGNYAGGQGVKYDKSAGTTTFQGAITASTLAIGTNGFHVDVNGNMWWGSATTYAAATIKISAAGSVDFTTGNFSGTLASGVSITSPVLTGGTVRTSSGSTRVEMAATGDYANCLTVYDDGYERVIIGGGLISFLTPLGVGSGDIEGVGTNQLQFSTGSGTKGFYINDSALYPIASSYDLGGDSDRWDYVFANRVSVYGSGSTAMTLAGDGTTMTLDKNFAPADEGSTKQLGTATNKWKDVYCAYFHLPVGTDLYP